MEPNASPEQTELAIEAQGLARRFDTVEALSNVSLQIRKGEFFSLLGPSGCGKTTLLRLIAGLDAPDAGTLKIGGRDASLIPAHQRPVNTVFQSYALFPHMTVRDNIAFGLRMKKVPAKEMARRVERIMQLVEVTELAARRPAQLSGGQKQRVALARAVVNEPEVLLLDEPLGALDLKLRRQLQLELHQLQRRLGITFVYVTHDQEEALVMSHRIAVMNAGRLEQVDTGQQLYERPRTQFVAQFVGSCNLISARVCGVAPGPRTAAGSACSPQQLLEFQSGPFRLYAALPSGPRRPGAGAQVNLALRPEKIRLCAPGTQDTETNAIDAVIEDLVYSGAETTYHLRTAGLTARLSQAAREVEKPDACPGANFGDHRFKAVALNARVGRQDFRLGETVSCRFGEDALILLED